MPIDLITVADHDSPDAHVHEHLTDGRLALRRFAKMPGWTIVSAGTLALGLAASIVTGVLARDLLWRPLPLAAPALRAARIDPVTTLRQD